MGDIAGQAEPLTYDDGGNKVYELLTFTVEERDVDPEANVDRMVRRSITATNMEELKQSASIPDNPGKPAFTLLEACASPLNLCRLPHTLLPRICAECSVVPTQAPYTLHPKLTCITRSLLEL